MTTATRIKNWRRWMRDLSLDSGAHNDPGQGMCLLEAVAYMQGQPFSDHPQCVAPTIAAFGRSWNDSLPDADRQRLKRFIPLMVGTATTDRDEETRAWMATDWLVRTLTPAWLDLAGLNDRAAQLREMEALTNAELAAKAQPVIDAARAEADAAWAAARDAAGAAAWAAARAAARDAAREAAWDAVREAAGAAARAAAREAAREAARAAAWDAAWEAARAAARAVARAAADKALQATVKELQASAEDLLERMCAVGRAA